MPNQKTGECLCPWHAGLQPKKRFSLRLAGDRRGALIEAVVAGASLRLESKKTGKCLGTGVAPVDAGADARHQTLRIAANLDRLVCLAVVAQRRGRPGASMLCVRWRASGPNSHGEGQPCEAFQCDLHWVTVFIPVFWNKSGALGCTVPEDPPKTGSPLPEIETDGVNGAPAPTARSPVT